MMKMSQITQLQLYLVVCQPVLLHRLVLVFQNQFLLHQIHLLLHQVFILLVLFFSAPSDVLPPLEALPPLEGLPVNDPTRLSFIREITPDSLCNARFISRNVYEFLTWDQKRFFDKIDNETYSRRYRLAPSPSFSFSLPLIPKIAKTVPEVNDDTIGVIHDAFTSLGPYYGGQFDPLCNHSNVRSRDCVHFKKAGSQQLN